MSSTYQLVVNVLGLLIAVVHVHQLLTNVVLHPASSWCANCQSQKILQSGGLKEMLFWCGYLQGLKKSHLAAISPAVIFSCPEAPEPFHTKIFLPEDKNVNMKSKNILREKKKKIFSCPSRGRTRRRGSSRTRPCPPVRKPQYLSDISRII